MTHPEVVHVAAADPHCLHPHPDIMRAWKMPDFTVSMPTETLPVIAF